MWHDMWHSTTMDYAVSSCGTANRLFRARASWILSFQYFCLVSKLSETLMLGLFSFSVVKSFYTLWYVI